MNKLSKFYKWLLGGTMTALLITLITFFIVVFHSKFFNNDYEYACEVYRENIEYHYEGARTSLIDEIDKYIDSVAPKSYINGCVIFEMCDKYEVDMIFVLAQGQIESHFGTTGIAAITHSVWNVGSCDGKTATEIKKSGRHTYSHPDKSVEPYLQLLKRDFLVNGKTEKDMMVKFVGKKGQRYATALNYEDVLYQTYNQILTTTSLKDKIYEYMKYKSLKEN